MLNYSNSHAWPENVNDLLRALTAFETMKKVRSESENKSEQSAAHLVRRVAEMARETGRKPPIVLLLEKVAGQDEVTLDPFINHSATGAGERTAQEAQGDESSEIVIRRATSSEERGRWLALLAKLDEIYAASKAKINQEAAESRTPPASRLPAKIKAKTQERSDFQFIIEETASIVISLLKLINEEEDLADDNTVVIRLSGLLVHHLDILVAGSNGGSTLARTRTGSDYPKHTPLAVDGFLRAPADRITQSAIEAFMPGALKKGQEKDQILERAGMRGLDESYFAVYPIETRRKDLWGLGGFRHELGEALWETLQNKGELAIRAQFALWTRAYQSTNAEPGKYVTMTINQFCDDIGFSRNKGAHKRENKQSAIKILHLLTSFEISIVWKKPDGKFARVDGPIWQRGMQGSEGVEYADLLGSTQTGDPQLWEPTGFSYAPGQFFDNEEWRHYNRAVAMIGKGLLELSAQERDRWAVLVGGYIALQARFGDYRPKRFRVSTLLEKTGLIEQSKNRNAGRTVDKLEIALDKLKQVNVISNWFYTTQEADEASAEVDYDDLDSSVTRSALASESQKRRTVKAELEKVIEIHWPETLTEHSNRLAEAKSVRRLNPKPKRNFKR